MRLHIFVFWPIVVHIVSAERAQYLVFREGDVIENTIFSKRILQFQRSLVFFGTLPILWRIYGLPSCQSFIRIHS